MKTLSTLLLLLFMGSIPIKLASQTAWDSLDKQALAFEKDKKYKEAIAIREMLIQKDSISLTKEQLKNSQKLAILFEKDNQKVKAEQTYLSLIAATLKTPYKDSVVYGNYMTELGVFYRKTEKYAEALYWQKKAKNHLSRFSETHKAEYASCLNNLAIVYFKLDNLEEGIACVKKSLDFTDKKEANYSGKLNTLGMFYKKKGDYQAALKAYQEALKYDPKTEEIYLSHLNNIAILYSDMGLFEKAIENLKEAVAIAKTNNMTSLEVANRLDHLGYQYIQLANYPAAVPYITEALELRDSLIKQQKDALYYQYESHLALCYSKMGALEKAIALATEAAEKTALLRKGKDNQDYVFCLINLANIYETKGDFQTALAYNETLINLSKKIWGRAEANYLKILQKLVLQYNQTQQAEKANTCLTELAQIMNDEALHHMDVLPENAKEIFVQNFVRDYMPLLFANVWRYNNKNLSEHAYNALLAMKGTVLQSTRHLQNALATRDSLGEKVKPDSLINALQAQRVLLKNTLYAASAQQQVIKINRDSIKRLLDDVETNLIMRLPASAKTLKQVTTTDVQNALQQGEAAIEFIHFKYHNGQNWTDSVLYGAMVLKSGAQQPEFIPLFEEKELKNLLTHNAKPEQLYATRGKIRGKTRGKTHYKNAKTDDNAEQMLPSLALYNLIWRPLEQSLKNMGVVYYAPSGLLHRVAFAALSVNEQNLLSDKCALYAVSSSRELVLSKNSAQNVLDTEGGKNFKKESSLSAILYGAIRYDADSTALAKAKTTFKKEDDYVVVATDKITKRGNTQNAWNYLSGTKKEVDAISELFKIRQLPIEVKKGFAASEDDFKTIGVHQASPMIVHLATHGYFYSETQNANENRNQSFQDSDNPLIRSGLIMAGANKAWFDGKPYNTMDDGILTAYEISNMNLSNTKLVVLSACETGLGDIQGTEGVYGLQRAFKMAGVDYILMSLWQVGDAETAELMQQFYKNYLDGKPVRQAFQQAQERMKTKYSPYSWAGFVLIQ